MDFGFFLDKFVISVSGSDDTELLDTFVFLLGL